MPSRIISRAVLNSRQHLLQRLVSQGSQIQQPRSRLIAYCTRNTALFSQQTQTHREGSFQSPRAYSTASESGECSFPAWYVRGGTSKGLFIHKDNLPPENQWHQLLPQAMGSPDPYGRQLNGMGGGISSLSKMRSISKITIIVSSFLKSPLRYSGAIDVPISGAG